MITVKRFSASWCSPCRQLAPIMESVKSNLPDINFVTIDVDDNRKEAIKYGVNSVPTVIIENDGYEVKRFTGIRQESYIVNLINESR